MKELETQKETIESQKLHIMRSEKQRLLLQSKLNPKKDAQSAELILKLTMELEEEKKKNSELMKKVQSHVVPHEKNDIGAENKSLAQTIDKKTLLGKVDHDIALAMNSTNQAKLMETVFENKRMKREIEELLEQIKAQAETLGQVKLLQDENSNLKKQLRKESDKAKMQIYKSKELNIKNEEMIKEIVKLRKVSDLVGCNDASTTLDYDTKIKEFVKICNKVRTNC
jgi:hypothetical protein